MKRAIVWQVGNYPARDWNSWCKCCSRPKQRLRLVLTLYHTGEGPVFEKGKLKVWQHAWLPNRVFPIDLNGFAVNSSEIGVGRAIAPRECRGMTRLCIKRTLLTQCCGAQLNIFHLIDLREKPSSWRRSIKRGRTLSPCAKIQRLRSAIM